jgi:endoglucanase
MMRRFVLVSVVILVAFAVSGCAAGGVSSVDVAHVTRRDPLLGLSFYVDPANPAAAQASEWRSDGLTSDAAAIERIAKEPTADWFTGSEGVREAVRAVTIRATRARATSLLVAYDIPGRDCGSFSAGGASSAAAYRQWIGLFAQGIGKRSATVILEPDAIAQALSGCLSRAGAGERYELLRYAVRRLKADPHVNVYVDAGNVGWIRPPQRLVAPLRRAGVAAADGFALNVSNFYSTQATVQYGVKLSHALGGAHFVIDTGRNGNGPEGRAQDQLNWCNPPGRALGQTPSTNTASPLVDAYLWIKQPGASDGSCRPGEPAAGQWWPQYALELAQDTH